MKSKYYKIFSIICTILLVFSTLAPSITFANDGVTRSIELNLSDENRMIESAVGSIQSVNNGTGYPEFYVQYDHMQKSFILNNTLGIDMQTNYVVTWNVKYSENDQSYLYFDQVTLTGGELLSLASVTVPKKEELKQTSLVNNVEDLQSSNLQFIIGGNAAFYHYLNNSSVNLVVKKDSKFPISFFLSGTKNSDPATVENQYLISETIDFTTPSNSLSGYVANLAHVKIEAPTEYVYFSKATQGYGASMAKDIYISKGDYNVNYGDGNYRWNGNVSINGNETLILPEYPTELNVKLNDKYVQYNDPTKVNIDYQVNASNGAFKLEYFQGAAGKVQLMEGEEVIQEFDSNFNSNYLTLDFGDRPTGEYTLLVSMVIGEKTIKGSTTIAYTSPWQELKGTIVIAENAEGNVMKDTVVELYEKAPYGYEKVATERTTATATGNNGEVFIPDAYILKDQPYVFVVKSEQNKVAYIHEFEGQSTNQFHFEASSLKDYQLNTGSLKTLGKALFIGDTNNGQSLIPIEFLTEDWKMSTNISSNLAWYGENNDGSIGYIYYGSLEDAMNIADVKWTTYKPSSKYQNAKLGDMTGKPTYLEFNLFSETNANPFLLLEVTDGNTVYSGEVNVHGKEEVAFGEYSGHITKIDSTSIGTNYRDQFNQGISIYGGEIELTYELKDSSGKTTELTTNSLTNLPLNSALADGSYTLSLFSASTNDVVTLKMEEQPITIGDGTNPPTSTTLDKFYVEKETPYGQVSKYNGGFVNILELVQPAPNVEYYNQVGHFYYSSEEEAYVKGYSNLLDPTKKYIVLVEVRLDTTTALNSIPVIELREMTGEEILAISKENPFEIKDNLKKLTVNAKDGLFDKRQVNLNINLLGNQYLIRYISGYEKIEAYLSPGTYNGAITFEEETTREFIDVPKFELQEDKIITLQTTDLAKIEVVRNNKALPIFGFNPSDSYLHQYPYNSFVTSHHISKRTYNPFSLAVGITDQYDTPWGYVISKATETITQDEQFEFTGEITGEIADVNVYKNYQIQAFLNLSSDDFAVERIYHAVKNPYRTMQALTVEENPIRDYYGLFDNLNEVRPAYIIKDANGNKVLSGISNNYNVNYLNVNLPEELADGTYTLEVNVPTAPRKSLKLEKEFTIGAEQGPFVKISSPSSNFITNNNTVTVEGTATKDATLTVALMQGTNKVDSKIVTSDGTYSVAFDIQQDGDYTVVVTNDTKSASVQFKVDRTAPAKSANIEFTENSDGLTVSWGAVEDAKIYKVEVAENDGDFTERSSQTGVSYLLSNIQPGTTYKVRIIAVDEAGNKSVSEVATKKIAEFITTAITVEDKRKNSFLIIDDTLAIALEGSYKEGYKAKAFITIDGTENEISLTYNETTKKYEGSLKVEAGNKVIESIKGYILDGTNQTEEKTVELNWAVGSTVTGSISDGEPVKDATIRLRGAKASYTTKSNNDGTFTIAGIAPGTYSVSATVNNQTTNLVDSIIVGESVVKEIDEIQVTAYIDPVISFVTSDEKPLPKDNLFVRIDGPNNFVAYGITKDSKFETYGGYSLKNIATGDYKVTVFGAELYKTTEATISFKKGQNDYNVTVDKENIETKDIVIELPNVTKLEAISLYSPSINEKFYYSRIGNYYNYDVTVENNQIVFKDVVVSDDYQLHIMANGYMTYNEMVNLTTGTNFIVNLEQGREISGKVTDAQESPLGFVYVYGYAGNTYYSTKTDGEGEYTLKGLSKTDDVHISVYSQAHLDENKIVPKGEEPVQDYDIQLSKAASMTGKVVDKDLKPMANVSISVSGNGSYGWARTATDGTFSVNGLKDTENYEVQMSSYGYPTLTKENVKAEPIGQFILQKDGDGQFNGEGNHFAVSKTTVVPGEQIEFTLAYRNNGSQTATNVPVTIQLPTELKLIKETVQLNGKPVEVANGVVQIPSVAAGESGKVTFKAQVNEAVSTPSLTATVKVTDDGNLQSATTSVVFITLEAPAQTGSISVKVYGSAKLGSKVEVFANNKLVGQAKVDSKWWYADIKLPVTDSAVEEKFAITAKVTSGNDTVNSKPTEITYTPNVPVIKDVTVKAGWNGNVKLNPYTGVATFAITEHTPLDTTIKFDKDVDTATLTFLGKTYDMKKGTDNTFSFDGNKLGKWTSYGEQLLEVTFKKGDVEITIPLMNIIVLIDPSGFVFEGSMDNRLEGVQAVVETRATSNDPWVQWNAEKFGQINPQVTDENGRYGWDVIQGEWRVIFTKEGYEPYISRVMKVPPAETELNIPMVKIGNPNVSNQVQVSENNLTVTFDRYMNTTNKAKNIKLFEVAASGKVEVAGEVSSIDKKGYKSIDVPEAKETGFVSGDSKGQDGFFEEDNTKLVSKSFTFIPTSVLKPNTDYVLVVSEDMEDTESRKLENKLEFTFKTAPSSTTDPGTGGNTGGNNGGGSGGNTGGTTPEPTPNNEDAEGVTVVKDQDVTKQVNDTNSKEVIVNIPALTTENTSVKVEVSPTTLKLISDSGKPFVLTSGELSLKVPKKILSDIAQNKTDKVQFKVELVQDGKIPGAGNVISNVYEFSITKEENGKVTKITNFSDYIEVSLPVNQSQVKDPNKTAAYYVNEQTNQLEYVSSKFKNGTLTFKTNHFSKFVVIENNNTFKDITNSWAKNYIESLASKTLIKGKAEDLFAPNDQITRAEFAVLLARTLNLPKQEYEKIFLDVNEKMTWSVYEIEAANRAGIVFGLGGKFNPNENISRQEMASMIIRAIKYVNPTALEDVTANVIFADEAKIANFAKESVSLAAGLGIISGINTNDKVIFEPTENATREQTATMLYFMLEKF
ncbi:carboxypeptidase regulatory-like domain-containing protein [Lysinibacillus antri]|uniref:DUF11 domain-containing protein n=1 Tax=Lysinibacillus antri TaxID=2498145 RepID=A0A3S0RUG2_9BACI|nr:carboxypeptidase regulatory-like domain-containing protein [Lysinibacillus antri]RUL49804.1 DUF11 domain-containing protein [Lysinibacillus antri]